jgi:hypothetical protein
MPIITKLMFERSAAFGGIPHLDPETAHDAMHSYASGAHPVRVCEKAPDRNIRNFTPQFNMQPKAWIALWRA